MYKNYFPTAKKTFFIFYVICLVLFQNSCNQEVITNNNTDLKYVKTISWSKTLTKDIEISFHELHKTIRISHDELPLKNCLVVNTPSIAYLNELDEINSIKAVCSPNYIYNTELLTLLKKGKVMDVGNDSQWNIEKILSSNIQYVFTSYNPTFQNYYKTLENKGIKIIYIEEFKENVPLARAEIIKLFGVLFQKESLANNKFEEVEKRYNELKEIAKLDSNKPSVFSKIMYSDVWYMPEGKSFAAQLYKDANTNYYWSSTEGNQSLLLSFEDVYSKAKNADYWLEVGDFQHKEELKTYNSYYQYFSAYKKGTIYSLSQDMNSVKANNYYERGVFRVDEVLQDIIIITHPNVIKNTKLKYYKQLL